MAKANRKNYHKALVPALDALIGDPSILEPEADTKKKAEELIIPEQYVYRVRDFRNDQTGRGEASTKLLASFSHILEAIHYSDQEYCVCKNGMIIKFARGKHLKFPEGESKTGSTIHTIAAANYYQDIVRRENVAILTGDNSMISISYLNGIDVARINPETYDGRVKVEMPESIYNKWFSKGFLTKEELITAMPKLNLHINEFVEFELDDELLSIHCQTGAGRSWEYLVGRYHYDENGEPILEKLKYINNLPKGIELRTAGQAMFAEALLAPVEEIPIVICPATFGTGKTYLGTSIGTALTTDKNPRYDRVFVCPRDSELGEQVGFLPGDERGKTIPKAMPIIDNLREYLKNRGDRKSGGALMDNQALNKQVDTYLDKYFDFVPIINMGGRSITDSWIIYDEAQDMERFQINQLMKRIGDGSKMVIIGDPHQIYNKHMNFHSNGLSYAAVKMAGSPYATVITMYEHEITRCEAAREIAKRFDH